MATNSTILIHRPNPQKGEGYPQDARVDGPTEHENVQDALPVAEVPQWAKDALAHEDIMPVLESVKKGREELMTAHPYMPRFVDALVTKRLFDVSVHGMFEIEDDEPVDVEGYGAVSFRRDETGYVVVITKDDATTERPVAEVLPDFNDYRPQFDEPTGLFRSRLIRAKMLGELQRIANHNEESANFWGAWLQGFQDTQEKIDRLGNHRAARAYLLGMIRTQGLVSAERVDTVVQLEVRDTREGVEQYLVGAEVNVWTGEKGKPYEFVAPFTRVRVRPGNYREVYRNDDMGYVRHSKGFDFDSNAREVTSLAEYWDVEISDIKPRWSENVDLGQAIADDKQALELYQENVLKRIEEAKKVAVLMPVSALGDFERALRGLPPVIENVWSPEACLRFVDRLKGLGDGGVPGREMVPMSPRRISLLRDTFNDVLILRECQGQIARLSSMLRARGKMREVHEITGDLAAAYEDWMTYRRQLGTELDGIVCRNKPIPPRVSVSAWEDAVRRLARLSEQDSTTSMEPVSA